MIRAKKIQLVIVTALLASCNRTIIPEGFAAGSDTPDSSLTRTPVADETRYDCNCVFNPYYQPLSPYQPYSLDFSFYYSGQPYGYAYTPGRNYRKALVWHNNKFILRGGFGKTTASTAS
jgi:hypothetical protein